MSLIFSTNSEISKLDDGKTSRIKFKSFSSFFKSDYSRTTSHSEKTGSRRSTKTRSIGSIPRSSSQDIIAFSEPDICFHPECCFAYNLTDDMRRPSLLALVLPFSSYQQLARIWNLDPHIPFRPEGNSCLISDHKKEDELVEEYLLSVAKDLGLRTDISEDLHVQPGSHIGMIQKDIPDAFDSTGSITDCNWESPMPLAMIKGKYSLRSEILSSYKRTGKDNPYLKFLKKMEHMESKEPAKFNLGKKAGKITKMIIKNFLEWYQSLGGNDGETFIEESTLQELFQIGFDMPAAKALAIRIKEMPTVPECLASLRNEPKHAIRYGLRKFLKQDMALEKIPLKMFAFGSMLPKEKPSLRYKPPNNKVQKTWLECSRVPSDLDSMKTVWGGLEMLRSTIAFSNWLKNHPEVKPPTYLEAKGLLKINYEEWDQMYKGFEVAGDNIEMIPSDTKIFRDLPPDSRISTVSSFKYDSSDSFIL